MNPAAIFLCVETAIGATLGGWMLGERIRRRRLSDKNPLYTPYLQILLSAFALGESETLHFPLSKYGDSKRLLILLLSGLTTVTYGLDPLLVRRVVRQEGLDDWLFARIRHSMGYRRAFALAAFACLPPAPERAVALNRYLNSRNRCVRFYALLAQIAADPSMALRCIILRTERFSPREIAEICALLRRGMLPVAYEPLLSSTCANLRRIGLAIVRQFGITQAELQVVHIIDSDPESELGVEALWTLCSLRRPVSRREVFSRLERMNVTEKRALLRYMASEGYSVAALRQLFGESEQACCDRLVQSYKRKLA